ncbi:MAG: T9SS type A sorting domain-containing protein [Lewinella sp.]|jgi:hypothetical protein|uniref:T9SS type A sorting domain-containing protein n=1 Tax=Lewinella sp. TaxID=2004506 RepID=UPI003D6B683A
MQLSTITLTLFFLVVVWTTAGAQIILTSENSTPPAGYTDRLYFGFTDGITVPTGGAAQVWDYADVDFDFPRVTYVTDERDSPIFTQAYSSGTGYLKFQEFEADAVHYEGADEEGFYAVGRLIEETGYPLTTITGNPDDTFLFLADTFTYEGRINVLSFPMTYQDTYESDRIERTNLALTVAAFGLTNAPVESRRYYTESHSVIGYGQVIIPLEDHSPSPPIDVLLVQIDATAIDSFFIGGMVAPPNLTAPFGVSQGMVSTEQVFVFLTPGMEAPVVRINFGAGGAEDFIYRPRAADLVSSTRELSTARLRISPNPVPRGGSLKVQIDQEFAVGSMRLLNQQGQMISVPEVNTQGKQCTVEIPSQLPAGVYYLQAIDLNGRMIPAQRIVVQ